jgi:hypothetical protein
MFLMITRAEYAVAALAITAVQPAEQPPIGRQIVAGALPPAMLPALSEADLERISAQSACSCWCFSAPSQWFCHS